MLVHSKSEEYQSTNAMCFKAIQWFLLGFSLNLATLFMAKDMFGLEAKKVKSRMSTRQVVCKEKTHKEKFCI